MQKKLSEHLPLNKYSQNKLSLTHLILDVDAAPGILSASVPEPGVRVSDGDVGAHHSEGHPLPHPVVLRLQLWHWEVVDLDLMLLQLQKNLKKSKIQKKILFIFLPATELIDS